VGGLGMYLDNGVHRDLVLHRGPNRATRAETLRKVVTEVVCIQLNES